MFDFYLYIARFESGKHEPNLELLLATRVGKVGYLLALSGLPAVVTRKKLEHIPNLH